MHKEELRNKWSTVQNTLLCIWSEPACVRPDFISICVSSIDPLHSSLVLTFYEDRVRLHLGRHSPPSIVSLNLCILKTSCQTEWSTWWMNSYWCSNLHTSYFILAALLRNSEYFPQLCQTVFCAKSILPSTQPPCLLNLNCAWHAVSYAVQRTAESHDKQWRQWDGTSHRIHRATQSPPIREPTNRTNGSRPD